MRELIFLHNIAICYHTIKISIRLLHPGSNTHWPAIKGNAGQYSYFFLHIHLKNTEFNVIAGDFTSENRYRGGPTSFGSGQGGEASGFHWNINQDITNKALEASETQTCVICHPITREVQTNNGIVFADDLAKISISSIEQRSNEINISTVQQSVQLANNCLRASGGYLSSLC